MDFEWDAQKAEANLKKHGITFDEAKAVFNGDYLELLDEWHSDDEERLIAIGPIQRGIVLVVWTERVENRIRIISARMATTREKNFYRKYIEASGEW